MYLPKTGNNDGFALKFVQACRTLSGLIKLGY